MSYGAGVRCFFFAFVVWGAVIFTLVFSGISFIVVVIRDIY